MNRKIEGWLRRARASSTGRAGGEGTRAWARQRFRPDWLALEDRRLMATFVVTNPADTLTDGVPTVNTLRWAVGQANAASSPSTIDFNLGTAPATITLAQGDLELSNVLDPVTIDGPGSGRLAIDGNDASRIFKVDQGVAASSSDCEFVHGSMSLGGAITTAAT